MSVYRDTNASVVFEHPHPGPLTATVYREGSVDPILTVSDLSPVLGKYTLDLTWRETAMDGILTINWADAVDFLREQQIEVVTPLVSLAKLRTLFPGENKQDSELMELEQTVRVFIQAYTGQSYGLFRGSKTFAGTGSQRILLDQRVNSISGFAGAFGSSPDPTQNLNLVTIGADGWSLLINHKTWLTVKDAPPEELWVGQGGVIRVPPSYLKEFDEGAFYTVTGVWGYEFVPDEVQEAAMLLANDFSCTESIYRDRYLESIKIQQDTIIYHPGAFRGTGNARADLLLGKFRRSGMVII